MKKHFKSKGPLQMRGRKVKNSGEMESVPEDKGRVPSVPRRILRLRQPESITQCCGSYRHYGSMDSWGKGERESLKPYDERYTIKKSVV